MVDLASSLHRSQVSSTQLPFYVCTLAPTVAIVAYGAFALSNGGEPDPDVAQGSHKSAYVLQYADGNKALFKTNEGIRLVVIGSSLASAGEVVAIEKQKGRWTVRTNKNVKFVQN